MFAFLDSELVELRKLDMKARFYDVLNSYEKLENQELKNKVEYFKKKVKKYKTITKEFMLKDVAKMVVEEFELDKINLFQSNGEKINDEIDKFISRLPEKTAYEFLVNYPNFSVVFENECSGDAVNVMTIHKSKGIEFKAVFVINTSKMFNLRTTTEMIVFNKQLGAALEHFDTETRTKGMSIPLSAIRLLETRKLVEEQQRLLYVALTRAKEKLFVVCSKAVKSLNIDFPKHPMSFINWFEPIISKCIEGNIENDVNFESYEMTNLLEIPEKEERQVLFEEQEVERLARFEYKYLESAKVPLKNSISKIIQKNQNNYALFKDDNYENVKFDEDEISAADRGTIYHKVFELVDLKNLQNLDNQFEEIKNQFNDKEWDIVDLNSVKAILENDLFKNIQADDVILKEREFYAKMPAKMYDENAEENDEFIMQGVIDLLIIKGNDAILVDYKTGKLNDEKLKNYSYQLNAYADVASRSFNVQVKRKILCFVDLQKIIEI